jgi:hypothetical protein
MKSTTPPTVVLNALYERVDYRLGRSSWRALSEYCRGLAFAKDKIKDSIRTVNAATSVRRALLSLRTALTAEEMYALGATKDEYARGLSYAAGIVGTELRSLEPNSY